MKNKIEISLPLDDRKIAEIEETLVLHEDDKLFLTKAISVLGRGVVQANKKGDHEVASKLADILRTASINRDDLEAQDRNNY